jgi:hypothetical protein
MEGVEHQNMVLRTVYLPLEVDEALRARAYAERISNGEMIGRLVRAGLLQDQAKGQAEEAGEAYERSELTAQKDEVVNTLSTAVGIAMGVALGRQPRAEVIHAALAAVAGIVLGIAAREQETTEPGSEQGAERTQGRSTRSGKRRGRRGAGTKEAPS